jgi:hypothetical protein
MYRATMKTREKEVKALIDCRSLMTELIKPGTLRRSEIADRALQCLIHFPLVLDAHIRFTAERPDSTDVLVLSAEEQASLEYACQLLRNILERKYERKALRESACQVLKYYPRKETYETLREL